MKKLSNPKTLDYLNLKSRVLGSDFSWYWVNSTTPKENSNPDPPYLSHCVLRRPNDSGINNLFPQISSPYAEDCNVILRQVVEENSITINSILRINFNLTFPGSINHTNPHYDHEFDHSNLLIYFTNSGGKTVCEDAEIDPIEDDIIIFRGLHYHHLPKNDRRVVMVATFI